MKAWILQAVVVIPLLIFTLGDSVQGFVVVKKENIAVSSIDIKPDCEPGTHKSQNIRRVSGLHKEGTQDDPDTHLELLTLAAERGDADAQYTLGVMYARGDGVTQDYQAAFHWISLAAEQNHTKALSCIGTAYLKGEIIPRNYELAVNALTQAARQGDSDAQFNLATMYAKGEGVSKDLASAFQYYSLAAEQANADAQYALGFMYYYGDGVTRDYAKAYMWFDIAGSLGKYSAIEYRNSIQRHITPAELSRAKELTRQCIAKNFKGC